MDLLHKLFLSLLSAIAWGLGLELVAWLAGRAYRHTRGASGMLDEAIA